ncbi:hypothetical protein OJF2_39600 [Aquisphaera giovannonii]|uniref:Uncharacterized protein n=1 Tax=Aquisphaera giovannonii TaxID=406548 RepID=A0A5B9W493_9BACT|nr:hypothetical protein [Aquisphaera giovannonii]QEH35408.1 hypothetical protein OJF2_39600 [Aquisphaera giovannonii]
MSLFSQGGRRDRVRGKRPRISLDWERIEERVLPANILVVNTAATGAGSLRQAILDANQAGGADTIQFHIPDNGTGVYQIDLAPASGALPAITGVVTIDGTSEAAFLGKAAVVKVNGTALTSGDGLTLAAGSGGSVIQGLTVFGFLNGYGILAQSDGNTIGGTGANQGNVLYSDSIGVKIDASAHNALLGNVVGTDASGTNFGGMARGVLIAGGTLNTIGGTAAGAGNAIGFATTAGVEIDAAAAANLLQGNLIGTDAANQDRGNAVGVLVGGGTNTIGGATAGAGNTVAFSTNTGILINGAAATSNAVQGNFIGTNASGGNLHNLFGVQINQAGGNTIGGAGAGNQIDFNTGAGILISGPTPSGNLIGGNLIGTDSAAAANRGNAYGIQVLNSDGNTIGGASGLANTVGFSAQQGVSVLTGTGNRVSRNLYAGGSGPPADIVVAPGANDGIAAPVLGSASVDATAGTLTLSISQPAGGSQPVDLEVYLLGAGSRVFKTTIAGKTLTATPQQITVANAVGFTTSDSILVTATDPTGSTSPFSNVATIGNALVVSNANDGGSGSLRTAITNALASPGATITFAIPGAGPHLISLLTPLPPITAKTIIDATTQPGYAGSPTVFLVGAGLPGTADGILLAAGSDGSTVKGLGFVGFGGAAIHVRSSGDVVASNFVGVDATGKAAGPGNGVGILVDTGTGNTVGGTAAADRNVIGSNGIGVALGSAGNVVEGNFVGVADAGTHDNVGNVTGISISAAGNTVGGAAGNVLGFNVTGVLIGGASAVVSNNLVNTTAAGANLGAGTLLGIQAAAGSATIAGNTVDFTGTAISLEGPNNVAAGNKLGTHGTASPLAFSNGVGVSVTGAGNTVGGTTAAAANVIGFASTAGVQVGGGATGTSVEGNLIGTDSADSVLTNNVGVLIQGASGNTVGGALSGQANTVANSVVQGVSVLSGGQNVVSRNTYRAGAGPAADIVLGPGANGGIAAPILASAALDASGNLRLSVSQSPAGGQPVTLEVYVSGTTRSFRQAIPGVTLTGTAQVITVPNAGGITTSDTVLVTATDPSGDTSAFSGVVAIGNALQVTNANDGGTGSLRAAVANVLAGAGSRITFAIPGAGPHLINLLTPLTDPAGITAAIVIDATTQPDYAGTPTVFLVGAALGSSADGILLAAGSKGSTVKGLGFVGFGGAAIHVGSDDNTIASNFLGVDATGRAAGPGNGVGVLIDAGSGNTVGGTTAAARNVIGSNAAGVSLASAGNVVEGNFIGVADAGSRDNLANLAGVAISAAGNTVGGTTAGAANVIGFNPTGVLVSSAGTAAVVAGNFIGTDPGGNKLGAGVAFGVRVMAGASQNTIGGAAAGAGNTIDFLSGGTAISLEGSNNTAAGNKLGTQGTAAAGGSPVAFSNAIDVAVSGTGNTVGGTAANVIGFASSAGIQVVAGATGTSVAGNFIGTDPGGAVLTNNVGVLIQGAGGNTIGGAGGGNTIANSLVGGVSINSGDGNTIRENTYTGSNGQGTPAQANDIILAAGANSGQLAPTVQGASLALAGGSGTLSVSTTVNPVLAGTPTFEVYRIVNGAREFLGAPLAGDVRADGGGTYTFTLAVTGVTTNSQVLLTDTAPGGSTSPFSNAVKVAEPNEVTNNEDTGTGSLRQVIHDYNLSGTSTTIIFGPAFFTTSRVIALESDLEPITRPVTIDVGTPGAIPTYGLQLVSLAADGSSLPSAGTSVVDVGLDGGNLLSIRVFDAAGRIVLDLGEAALPATQAAAITALKGRVSGLLGSAPDPSTRAQVLGQVQSIVSPLLLAKITRDTNPADPPSSAVNGLVLGSKAGAQGGSSGSSIAGLSLFGFKAGAGLVIQTTGNSITRGYFGYDPDAPLAGNGNGTGILLAGGSGGNSIGGAAAVSRVFVAGNTGDGIDIGQAGASGASDGNWIINATVGTTAFQDKQNNGNRGDGIRVTNSSGNTIGGPAADNANRVLVSGNGGTGSAGAGVRITGGSANVVANALIGTSETGAVSSGNFSNPVGVLIEGSSAGNTIGYSAALAAATAGRGAADPLRWRPDSPYANVISGNLVAGVELDGVAGNSVVGNQVGSDITGVLAIGNGSGAQGKGGIWLNGSWGNAIGGDDAAVTGPGADGNAITVIVRLGNSITDNARDGILAQNDRALSVPVADPSATTPANTVRNNLISRNTLNGIHFVGDLTGSGVTLTGPGGHPSPGGFLAVEGNLIGTTADGLSAHSPVTGASQGNGLSGILLEQSAAAAAGTSLTGVTIRDNTISGNGLSGITAQAAAGGTGYSTLARVAILGNFIGLNRFGTSVVDAASADPAAASTTPKPMGNVLDGILIDGLQGVTVGGTAADAFDLSGGGAAARGTGANVISGNLGRGIEVRNVRDAGPGSLPILIQGNIIGMNAAGQAAAAVANAIDFRGQALGWSVVNMGNLGDGIFLLGTSNVQVFGNLISANRAAGIHAATQTPGSENVAYLAVRGNRIGTDAAGGSISQTVAVPGGGGGPGSSQVVNTGNGSDGLFLDGISGAMTVAAAPGAGGTAASFVGVDGNIIAGNRANGIDLLQSSRIGIGGNWIGTNSINGTGLGNSANGIFINGSSDNEIGGAGGSNVIAGNQASGILISKGADASGSLTFAASRNAIAGNFIGAAPTPDGRGGQAMQPNPNRVSGLVISGGTSNAVDGNVISGNLLYGVLLANSADGNTISGNFIGTDAAGDARLGNTSEGVFVIGGNDSNRDAEAVGNAITGNTISGNQGNGVHLFGSNTVRNSISGNVIGLDPAGNNPIANQGNGIYLDATGKAGGATEDANLVAGNVVSGNGQSGVMIYAVETTPAPSGYRNILRGNFIGTNRAGTASRPNGGNGVFIYGSSLNLVGGADAGLGGGQAPALTLGASEGNLISGNAQAGVAIFSPVANLKAFGNDVYGNFIGTDASGMAAIPNADGVDILSAQGNRVGGAGLANLISGNLSNGVYVTRVSDNDGSGNAVASNLIGTDRTGAARLAGSQQAFGVYLYNVTGNVVGQAGGATLGGTNVPLSPANVISGNAQAGVRIGGTSSGNAVQGNYIGLGLDGTAHSDAADLSNLVGVMLADQAAGNAIGGAAPGAGNILTQGSLRDGTAVGVEASGPGVHGNAIQGNLIGLDRGGSPVLNGQGAVVSQIGVLINGSPGNLVGGASTAWNPPGSSPTGFGPSLVRNVISGNAQAGVEITGPNATGNAVQGNFLGTNLAGDGRPAVPAAFAAAYALAPTQTSGVYILNARGNVVGGHGFGNLISGNQIGVNITGPATTAAAAGSGSNAVLENIIGTDLTGTRAVPNFEFGVFVNGSPNNLIDGNLISANGLAGVEISGGGSQVGASQNATGLGNVISNNRIGTNIAGAKAFPANPGDVNPTANPVVSTGGNLVYYGLQLHGVVILGTSSNTASGNLIAGNVFVGVYITRRDFNGTVYALPVGNQVLSNQVIANGIYGVLRYDAPQNSVPQGRTRNRRGKATGANTFSSNPIALADYITGFNSRSRQKTPQSTLLPAGLGQSGQVNAPSKQTTGKAHPRGPRRRKG